MAGVIIQEINRAFAVTDIATNTAIAAAALDAYVQDPASAVHGTEARYWELWEVAADGTVSDGGEDTFGLCSLIAWNGLGVFNFATHIRNSTRGNYVMSGSASFHAGLAVPAGFGRGTVAAAGGLNSTAADPSAGLPAATSGPVNYAVTVTWDSRPGAGRSPYSAVV